MKETVMREDF